MTFCRDIISFIAVVTSWASISRVSLFSAGRFGYYSFVIMTKSINVAVNKAVMTSWTGVCGVTFCYASRSCNYIVIAMSFCIDFSCFKSITTGAISSFFTFFGAGCSFCFCPVAEIMPESIYVRINIAVTTSGAGMGCVTLRITSWFSNNILIIIIWIKFNNYIIEENNYEFFILINFRILLFK